MNVIVTNGAFTKGRRAGRRILRRSARNADVLLGCEFKFVNATSVLDRKKWAVVQYMRDEGTQGCVFAMRRKAGRILGHRLVLGTEPHGAEMNTRYWLVVDVELADGTRRTYIVGHLPPARYGHLWEPMVEQLRKITSRCRYPVAVGCDWNEDGQRICAATGLNYTGVGILGLAYTPGMHVSRAKSRRVGSDHLAARSSIR